MIGALLTALVVAREWERGTIEALLATPVGIGEFIIGKLVPNFAAWHVRHGCVRAGRAVRVRHPVARLALEFWSASPPYSCSWRSASAF